MSTITQRDGFRYSGVLESAYCLKELTVEIISDGCHLPGELLRMVYDLIGPDRASLTCDSMRCAGQDVTESFLGSLESGQRVIIEDAAAKLPDRSAFAGSVATDDWLVRVMVEKAGVVLQDAVKMMTLTPARILGLDKTIPTLINILFSARSTSTAPPTVRCSVPFPRTTVYNKFIIK